MKNLFALKGKPFFPLGGQTHNSSGYSAKELERAWKALDCLSGNTLLVPVYWEQIEPVENQFDFSSVEMLLQEARKRDKHLIFLWFATWKNGVMKYTPAWVKNNTKRFKRVIAKDGTLLPTLCAFCEETLEADKKAYCKLLEYLSIEDSCEQTVLGIQIENEPGILGSVRDYSPQAETAFTSQVPAGLIQKVSAAKDGPVFDTWKNEGGKLSGNWTEVFGANGEEYFTAWSIAIFIDKIAAAGKKVYQLPMYINVWLREQDWRLPGIDYPSGGAATNLLDIWKWSTFYIDAIAPDIYLQNKDEFKTICKIYNREDNPLFIPESSSANSSAINMFHAVGEHSSSGYHIFGIENIMDDNNELMSSSKPLADSYSIMAQSLPLIYKFGGEKNFHTVIEHSGMREMVFDFGKYWGMAKFYSNEMTKRLGWQDYHHRSQLFTDMPDQGRGFIIQSSENEFFLAGTGFRLFLRKKDLKADLMGGRHINYISVEEGQMSNEGIFTAVRRRNGDETDFGIWTSPDCGIIRVVLCD